jgi:hypothetical protein
MSIKITKPNGDYKITFDNENKPEYFDIKSELDDRVQELKGKGYVVQNDQLL